MRFGILGSLHVEGPGGLVRPGPARHRQLLVCLLQEPNADVPAGRLVDRLWGERSTPGSRGTLQGYVSLVRQALGRVEDGGEGRLAFTGAGYRLAVGADELDELVFGHLAAEGRAALRDGDPVTAWDRCGEALALWRGPALVDGPDDEVTRAGATRLEQHRLAVLVARADAGLALGHHGLLVAELEEACAANPLHEGLAARRILALYGSGRQADALAAYERLRRTLAEDLGLEPSPELRDVERAVLAHAPLGAPPPGPARGRRAVPPARVPTDGPDAVPPVRYARFGRHELAYQVWGADGGPTLVALPGFAQNIELLWEEPRAARWLRCLGARCRMVHFDKLGTGLSGRGMPPSSFPDRAREIEAVMDAAGLQHAFVGGFSEGGTVSALYAATHPERVDGLVLLGTSPSWVRRPDMPWLPTVEEVRAFARQWSEAWGTGQFTVALFAPSMLDDPDYVAWMARYERNSLSPAAVVDLWELNIELDVRSTLASIAAPTLVLHRQQELVDARSGQYLADHVPGARHQLLPGVDHLPWIGDADAIVDHVHAFVHRRRPPHPVRRVLMTVVCTVPAPSEGGDEQTRPWCQQVVAEADRFGGTARCTASRPAEVVATFDSPTAAVGFGAWVAHTRPARVPARVGIHTGEVEHAADGPTGPAVPVAERIALAAAPAEVRASASVRDLCAGTGITFTDRAEVVLPDFGELWTYQVRMPPPASG